MSLALIVSLLLGQAPAEKSLAPDIEKRVRAATVSLLNSTKSKEGNAVVIDRVGPTLFLLTSAHIVGENEQLQIAIFAANDRDGVSYTAKDAEVLKRSEPFLRDLAILKIRVNDPKFMPEPISLGTSKTMPVRTPFRGFSASATRQFGAEVRAEDVRDIKNLQKRREDPAHLFWKCRATPEPGRSGGPLVDLEGRLLGICSGGDDTSSYYTHIEEIRAFLRESQFGYLVK